MTFQKFLEQNKIFNWKIMTSANFINVDVEAKKMYSLVILKPHNVSNK